MNIRIKPYGYSIIGKEPIEGIRFCWKTDMSKSYLESAAFISRAKRKTYASDEKISAYTTSVSCGCILSQMKKACSFCRTGKVLQYGGMLTGSEIAAENIFMVLSDITCDKNKSTPNMLREFAYMGQGEPGFSYQEVREAILLTNSAMKMLGQPVFRHIFATSGVTNGVNSLLADIHSGVYSDTRVTLHFSLHAATRRDTLMPINTMYPYEEVINACRNFAASTNEKVCLGILLFRNFRNNSHDVSYTTSKQSLREIADMIDPTYFRVSLCELNSSDEIAYSNESSFLEDEMAEFVQVFTNKGIESKLFSSFGTKDNSACGLLASTEPQNIIGNNLSACFEKTLSILQELSKERL